MWNNAVRHSRRECLRLTAGVAAYASAAGILRAQTYPARPVHIIVGFPPGGAADITARLIGQWLSERMGQQFLIENRHGAGTNIATEAVERKAPEGKKILLESAAKKDKETLYKRR